MTARLERILTKLTQQHAPHLLPIAWGQGEDAATQVQKISRHLARHHILVLMAEITPEQMKAREMLIMEWIQEFARLYNLLAQTLFPSFKKISAQYTDDLMPPVVVINGQANAVVQVIAGYVVPYVALRQDQPVTDLELRGLAEIILEELEASDLGEEAYKMLRAGCVKIIRELLTIKARHIALTAFDRPVLDDIQPKTQPGISPRAPADAPPPDKLPEQEQLTYELEHLPEEDGPLTPTEQMFRIEIPLAKTKRLPPVPRLPGAEDTINE